MSDGITSKYDIYNQIKSVSRRLSKGRWYLKDFERIGAKITLTPHCADLGSRRYLYGCEMIIDEKTYYLIIRETPLLSKYIFAVNNKQHPGKKQLEVAEDIVRFFNEAYRENRNGIREEILRRNFCIFMGQIGMLSAWILAPLFLLKYFFASTINDLMLSGISVAIFLLCVILVLLAKKDFTYGGK